MTMREDDEIGFYTIRLELRIDNLVFSRQFLLSLDSPDDVYDFCVNHKDIVSTLYVLRLGEYFCSYCKSELHLFHVDWCDE